MPKNYFIVKLDTPLTLDANACQIAQIEPLNYAKMLLQEDPNCIVHMLSTISSSTMSGRLQTISIWDAAELHYVMKQSEIIIWQGRQCVDCIYGAYVIRNPKQAASFEAMQFLVMWQIMAFRLLTTDVAKKRQSIFICTDIRIPFIDLHKVCKTSCPNELSPDIKLVTQAKNAEVVRRYHNADGFSVPAYDSQLPRYVYQFKEAEYQPLQRLPQISHEQFSSEKKHGDAIIQLQTFKYLDEHRRQQIVKAVDWCKEQGLMLTLMGRFNDEGVALLKQYIDINDVKLIRTSEQPYSFLEAAKLLACYKYSIIIAEESYEQFGLCPNRVYEALAVGTTPIFEFVDLSNCDDDVLSIANQYQWNKRK